MAMEFGPGSLSVPADKAANRVYLDLMSEVEAPFCPRHGGAWGEDVMCFECVDVNGDARPDPEPTHQVRLSLREDEAVELATLLLNAATKLRAERLARQDDLDAAYAAREVVEDMPAPVAPVAPVQPVQRRLSPCYCDSVYHSGGC